MNMSMNMTEAAEVRERLRQYLGLRNPNIIRIEELPRQRFAVIIENLKGNNQIKIYDAEAI